MASWAAILAWSDYHYSGIDKEMKFTETPGRYFWSNGESWGICDITDSQATIKAIYGNLELDRLTIGEKRINLNDANITQGNSKTIRLK